MKVDYLLWVVQKQSAMTTKWHKANRVLWKAVILSFEGDIMNNEEKYKLLTISNSETISNSLGNLETCQSFDDLKYSYFQLFHTINILHHHLILFAMQYIWMELKFLFHVQWVHKRKKLYSGSISCGWNSHQEMTFRNKHPAQMQHSSLESSSKSEVDQAVTGECLEEGLFETSGMVTTTL